MTQTGAGKKELDHREVTRQLNVAIELLQRTMPEEGSHVAQAISVLEDLWCFVLEDRTQREVGPALARFEVAMASARALLGESDTETGKPL